MDNVEDILRLSPVQEGMLFHTLESDEPGVYVTQIRCRLDVALSRELFEAAWQAAIDRYDILRVAFVWEGGIEHPVQVVHRSVRPEWHFTDLRALSDSEQADQLQHFLSANQRRGFALNTAPLTRFALFQTRDTEFQFVWTIHHMIIDGWSSRIVLDAVQQHYNRTSSLAEPVTRWRDYIAWRETADTEAARQFWTDELAGLSDRCLMQIAAQPRDGNAEGGHAFAGTELSESTTKSLRDFAAGNRMTLSALARGVWAVLLSRYCSAAEVVFGVTVAGRPPDLLGVESAVGPFINTLPFRVQVPADGDMVAWLRSLQKRQLATDPFQFSSLTDIKSWCRLPSDVLAFETVLVIEHAPGWSRTPEKNSLGFDDAEYIEFSHYPLAVLLTPGPRLRIRLIGDGRKFDRRVLTALSGHLAEMFSQVADPGCLHIDQLPLIASTDDALHPPEDGREAVPETTLHQLFEAQADARPEAVAVRCGQDELSCRELNERANVLAMQLITHGVQPGDHVGLLAGRSVHLPVCLLAIFKAGAAYVPADPGYPEQRVRQLFGEANVKVVVCEAAAPDHAALKDRTVVAGVVDTVEQGVPNPDLPVSPDGTAYVIFTSGSTGRPQGVCITHRNIVHSTLARVDYYDAPVESFLLLSSISFDSSLAGICWSLTTGGALVIPRESEKSDPESLAALVQRHRISHLLAIPSLYNLLLEHSDKLISLKVAIVAGEVCPSSLCRRHRAVLPGTRLFNEYGPTEATIWCTVHEVTEQDAVGSVPIGKPIARTQVLVVDSQRRPLPTGVAGELVVTGTGVSPGYLANQELNASRFCEIAISGQDSLRGYCTGDIGRRLQDGAFELLGRRDQQVKIRGYRIELAEVEAVLLQHDFVQEAVVVTRSLSRDNESHKSTALLNQLQALDEEEACHLLQSVEQMTPAEVSAALRGSGS